jgi:hypothetical protein
MRRRPVGLAAAAFVASLLPAIANAENRTTIQISTVLASNEGRNFDPALVSLKNELKQLRFRSYQLVKAETKVLHGNGGQNGIELPGGRYLHITTREHTPDHLRLHILLNEDNHPVVNTYVKLELGSVVMLGGPRDQNGTLVITIGSRPWRAGDDGEPDDKPASHDDKPGGFTPGSTRELPPLSPLPLTPGVSAMMPASPRPMTPGR